MQIVVIKISVLLRIAVHAGMQFKLHKINNYDDLYYLAHVQEE